MGGGVISSSSTSIGGFLVEYFLYLVVLFKVVVSVASLVVLPVVTLNVSWSIVTGGVAVETDVVVVGSGVGVVGLGIFVHTPEETITHSIKN